MHPPRTHLDELQPSSVATRLAKWIPDIVSLDCEFLFKDTFVEVERAYRDTVTPKGTIWTDPVYLTFLPIPKPRYPRFDVQVIQLEAITPDGDYEALDAN